MKVSRKLPACQRGLALVETVITLPLMLFVMIAAAEVTNVFTQHTTLMKAARDGVRHAAEHAIDGTLTMNLSAQLIQETQNLVVYGVRTPADNMQPLVKNLKVEDVDVTATGGDNLEVHVSYAYEGILGSVLPGFGLTSDTSLLFNLDATVTMRAL